MKNKTIITSSTKKMPLTLRQKIILQQSKLKASVSKKKLKSKIVKKSPFRKTPLSLKGKKPLQVVKSKVCLPSSSVNVRKNLANSFEHRAMTRPHHHAKVNQSLLQYTFMPWAGQNELIEVRELIYSAVTFQQSNIPGYTNKRLIIVDNDQSVDKLCYSRDKLSVWKSRCLNIKQSPIVLANLTAIESMLNILIEKYRSKMFSGHNSVLYSLYSIGVINLCNAISSYAQQTNMLSVKSLARMLDCPSWIVDCRHQLSHPSINPPPEPLLHEAITFGFEWIDRIFWSKVTGIDVPKSITPVPSPVPGSEPVVQYSSNDQQEIDQIHSEICLLLFTNCSNRKQFLRKNLQQYITKNWNEFIRTFVSVLVIDVPINVAVKFDSSQFPSILMSRCSGLFHLIFSTMPNIVSPGNILIFFLNQMADLVISKLELIEKNLLQSTTTTDTVYDPDVILIDTSGNEDDHQLQLQVHSGYCWLFAIMTSLTKLNPKTLFERSFDIFGDLQLLKVECEYDWFRLFYKFVRFQPNYILSQILKLSSFFVDRMIPKDKFDHIVKMCDMFSPKSATTTTTENDTITTKNNKKQKLSDKSNSTSCVEKSSNQQQQQPVLPPSSSSSQSEDWNVKKKDDLEKKLISKKASALRPSNKANCNNYRRQSDQRYFNWSNSSVGCSLVDVPGFSQSCSYSLTSRLSEDTVDTATCDISLSSIPLPPSEDKLDAATGNISLSSISRPPPLITDSLSKIIYFR